MGSPPPPDESKAAIARLFTETSQRHDTVGNGLFRHFGRLLVERLDLTGNEMLLDVAAGAGASLFPAAEQLHDGGHVIGVDLAPGMVTRLETEIESRGVANAEARLADAEALPFDDGSFDAIVCGFGLFFFPDLAGALAESYRVLRSGGAFAASTFTPRGLASLDRIWRLISTHAPVPDPDPPEERLDRPRQLRAVLGAAGFAQVTVEAAPFESVFDGFDEWWGWIWSMEFSDVLARMDPETLGRFRRYALQRLSKGDERAPIRSRMDALLTIARKPPARAGGVDRPGPAEQRHPADRRLTSRRRSGQ